MFGIRLVKGGRGGFETALPEPFTQHLGVVWNGRLYWQKRENDDDEDLQKVEPQQDGNRMAR
jgi:hypothetical protein